MRVHRTFRHAAGVLVAVGPLACDDVHGGTAAPAPFDAGPATVDASSAPQGGASHEGPSVAGGCPPDMVDVGGSFCIDRYEGSLTAVPSTPEEPDPPRLALSPYYHPATRLAERDHRFWDHWRRHLGPYTARQIELPSLPSWRSAITYVVRAESLQGVVPSAYVDLEVARRACANAGKRLCTLREWTTACRGEDGTRYPYGSRYEKGRCNVGRPHPATRLHGMRSPNYHDPRLNLVTDDGHPLLRETGTTPDCRSIWNGDSAYDMVGNLDEWIEDPDGTFVGGFYARDTEWGCDARIQVHSPDYYDYSLGVRCCR